MKKKGTVLLRTILAWPALWLAAAGQKLSLNLFHFFCSTLYSSILDKFENSLIRRSGEADEEDTRDARAEEAAPAGRSTARPPSAPQQQRPRPPPSSSWSCGKSANKCRRAPPGPNLAAAVEGESRTPVAPWLSTSLENLLIQFTLTEFPLIRSSIGEKIT